MKKSFVSAASATSVASTLTVGVDTTMTHTRFNMRTGRNEKIGLIYKPNADYVRHQLERGKTPEELAKQFKMPPTAIHTMGHTEQAKKWWKEAGRKAAAKNRPTGGPASPKRPFPRPPKMPARAPFLGVAAICVLSENRSK